MFARIEIASELILRLKQGEEPAFRAIYDTLHERIFRMVQSLVKDSAKTEEIVQDAFVALWLNRDRLDAQRSLYPYVYQTAKRLAIDHFRRHTLENKVLNQLPHVADRQTQNTEEAIAYSELNHFADETIRRLPKQQQAVYMMSREQGLSYEEIADQLQISPNTVRNHMVSALKSIKLRFSKAGFVSLAYALLFFF